MKKFILGSFFFSLILVLNACGGGGSGSSSTDTVDDGDDADGSVSGLQVAEQMSLVTAQDEGSGSLSSFLRFALRAATPTSGDYVNDVPDIYVYDESMEVLDLVNEILCYMDQAQYSDPAILNQGNLIAMIDADKCNARQEDHSGDSNDQSSGQNQEFEKWIINSSRADNSSPQILRFWVPPPETPDPENMDPFDEIRGQVTITEGKSEDHPFGLFSMDFVGYMEGVRTMSGNLSASSNEAGNVVFEMFIDGGEMVQEQTHAILTPDGSSGQAYAHFVHGFDTESGGGAAGGGLSGDIITFERTVNIGFDSSHYLVSYSEEGTECLDRVNFNKNVWEYNLYNENGSRVSLNSGIPIKYNGDYGWAGLWGIWPEIPDGSQVTSADDESVTYTVVEGGGRMLRKTRDTLTLGDFIGDTFNLWDPEHFTNIQVEWNGTNFVKTGTESCDETGCQFIDTPDENIVVEPNDWLGLFKPGVGMIDLVVPENGQITNTLEIPLWVEEFVNPSDALFASAVTFRCFYGCLKPGITEEDLASGDIYLPDITEPGQDPHEYTFNTDTFTLLYNNQAVTLGSDVDASNTPNSWGMMSGGMVTSEIENPWEVWEQDVIYTWETGSNPWNRYTGLMDSNGVAVEFDEPLRCLYEDDEEGTFFLDYHGDGQLYGIPFVEVRDEESEWSHWQAAFVIPDGSELDCGGTPYYTKQMAIEQSMVEVDEEECSSLSVTSIGPPDNTFTDHGMGEAPTVTSAPAVIGGVVQ